MFDAVIHYRMGEAFRRQRQTLQAITQYTEALRLEPDFAQALKQMAEREVNARWQASMAPFFEELEGRRPDEGMIRLEEIFHLE